MSKKIIAITIVIIVLSLILLALFFIFKQGDGIFVSEEGTEVGGRIEWNNGQILTKDYSEFPGSYSNTVEFLDNNGKIFPIIEIGDNRPTYSVEEDILVIKFLTNCNTKVCNKCRIIEVDTSLEIITDRKDDSTHCR